MAARLCHAPISLLVLVNPPAYMMSGLITFPHVCTKGHREFLLPFAVKVAEAAVGLGGREIPGCRNAHQDSDFKCCHRTLLSDKGALCCAPRTHCLQTLCGLGPAPEHPESTQAANRKSDCPSQHSIGSTPSPHRDCEAEASTGEIITSKHT